MKNLVLRRIGVFFAVIVLAGCGTTQNTKKKNNAQYIADDIPDLDNKIQVITSEIPDIANEVNEPDKESQDTENEVPDIANEVNEPDKESQVTTKVAPVTANNDSKQDSEKQSFTERIQAWFTGINDAFYEWRTDTFNNKLISNSQGYDRKESLRERTKKRKKPDWVGGNNYSTWINKQNNKATMEYFYGEYIVTPTQIINNGVDLPKDIAYSKAYSDVLQQLARYIGININAEFYDYVNEEYFTTADGQKNLTQGTATEITSSRVDAHINNVYFRGGIEPPVKDYYEIHETKAKASSTSEKKNLTYTNRWLIISVSKDSIENARKLYENEREEKMSAERRREERIKNQKTEFNRLSGDHDEIIRNLNTHGLLIAAADYEKEKLELEDKYREEYKKLNDIYHKLGLLRFLENINDDNTGQEYRTLKNQIHEELDIYDLSSFLKKRILFMQEQMIKKDGAIAELRNSNTNLLNRLAYTDGNSQNAPNAKDVPADSDNERRQGYNIQSQTILISFPQRPNETTISTVDIFAANEMVSNLDYISFATINGMNALSKADYGLETPVTLVTWNEAARYCNWLSKLYRYAPCYSESKGQITGIDKSKNGYRLPERAEIIAMLQTRPEIFEADFNELGIWSSDKSPIGCFAYTLEPGSGSVSERLNLLPLENTEYDLKIGFRVVRNAR